MNLTEVRDYKNVSARYDIGRYGIVGLCIVKYGIVWYNLVK